ncbi:MAG: uroporphyrinogen-III synthase [Paludibacteraceae bacterium]|nr:uroporphyrinogen-III synthase [Paludibacteraceae bacterium]
MKVKKILISQPKPATEKNPYSEMADRYGVTFDFRQLIKIVQYTPKEFRAEKIQILDHTAMVFNSRHGIDNFFHLCEEMRLKMPDDMKYYCVSEKIAFYLQKYIQYRKRKVFFPTEGNTMAQLLPIMAKHASEKYLMITSDVSNNDLSAEFERLKLNVEKAVMYHTVSNVEEEGQQFDYDMVVFYTPAGVEAFLKHFPNYEQGEMVIGCLGSNTAAAIKNAGLRLDIEVPSEKFKSISEAIDAFLKENHKRQRSTKK